MPKRQQVFYDIFRIAAANGWQKYISHHVLQLKKHIIPYLSRVRSTTVSMCNVLGITIDYLLHGIIHTNIDDEIKEKTKLCSIQNKKRISKIIDVFIEEEQYEKMLKENYK